MDGFPILRLYDVRRSHTIGSASGKRRMIYLPRRTRGGDFLRVLRKPVGAGLAPAPRTRQITHKRTVREAGPYKDGATFAQTGRGGFHIRPSLSDISPGTWPSSLDKSSHMCYNKDTKELRQRMCRCREAPIEYRRQENKRIRLQDSCVRFLLF